MKRKREERSAIRHDAPRGYWNEKQVIKHAANKAKSARLYHKGKPMKEGRKTSEQGGWPALTKGWATNKASGYQNLVAARETLKALNYPSAAKATAANKLTGFANLVSARTSMEKKRADGTAKPFDAPSGYRNDKQVVKFAANKAKNARLYHKEKLRRRDRRWKEIDGPKPTNYSDLPDSSDDDVQAALVKWTAIQKLKKGKKQRMGKIYRKTLKEKRKAT